MAEALTDSEVEAVAREWEEDEDLAGPYNFTNMLSTYRTAAKQAKKRGDKAKALDYYNRMLSLSVHWHKLYGTRKSGISGGEVDRASAYLKRFKKITGTLYHSTFERDGAVENDVLLSPTDYKNLSELTVATSGTGL